VSLRGVAWLGGAAPTVDVVDARPEGGTYHDRAPWAPWGAPMMSGGRVSAAAARLKDGRLAIVGGYDKKGVLISGVEVFNPKKKLWASLPSLPTDDDATTAATTTTTDKGATLRSADMRVHSACAVGLPDGRLLLMGGADYDDRPTRNVLALRVNKPGGKKAVAAAQQQQEEWQPLAPMAHRRKGFGAVLLGTGEVLVAGGSGHGPGMLASCEVFDPANNDWKALAPMQTPRAEFGCCRLPNGGVLAVGGSTPTEMGGATSAEVYDVAAGSWAALPQPMPPPGRIGAAVTCAGGVALVLGGGTAQGQILHSALLWDPERGEWDRLPEMLQPRMYASVVDSR
jgi:hypothetical protein